MAGAVPPGTRELLISEQRLLPLQPAHSATHCGAGAGGGGMERDSPWATCA